MRGYTFALATAEQARRVDELAIGRYGVPGIALMEHAGGQAAALLRGEWPEEASRGVLVLCGPGNNGGDGYVVARHLAAAGLSVHVIAAGDVPEGDAGVMADAWRRSGGALERPSATTLAKRVAAAARNSGVVVDAILGTGIRSAPRPPLSLAITGLADARTGAGRPRVLALDVPSGVDVTTGEVPGVCVDADVTVTFGIGKVGLASHPGARHAGRVEVARLGWPAAALDAVPIEDELLDEGSMRRTLPRLDAEAHKGDRGRVLVIAGRDTRPGAAALCCHAAFRAGAGLVTLATTAVAAEAVVAAVPEVMIEPLPGEKGVIAAKSAARVLALAAKADVVVFGPGIGVEKGPAVILSSLRARGGAPLVVDADGLTLLAAEKRTAGARECVLTPHPGEMGRLLGIGAADVQAARLRCAREAAARFRSHVVLKGARTLVASAAGPVAVNTSGNPGLATAGAGDVLAGVIAAWIGRGMAPLAAAKAAVWAHGAAADLAAREIGPTGFLARDVADRIPAIAGSGDAAGRVPPRSRTKRRASSRGAA